jgi:hypothetical protein
VSVEAISVVALILVASWRDAPFDDAAHLPADVQCYIHVDRAADLRDRLAASTIDAAFSELFDGAAVAEAWKGLAELARLDEAALFDRIFTGPFTVAMRHTGPGEDVDWVAMAGMSREAWQDVERRWRPQWVKSRHGAPVRRLPEQQLLLARLDGRVLAGPDGADGFTLFDETLARVNAPAGKSLATSIVGQDIRSLGDGDGGFLLRHDAPLGGWTAGVVSVAEEAITLRHASHFADSPLGDPFRAVAVDPSIVRAAGADQAATLVRPFRIPTGHSAAWVRSRMPVGSLPDRVQTNFGEVLIVSLGSALLDGGVDDASPVLSIAVGLKSADTAHEDLDRMMDGLTVALSPDGGADAGIPRVTRRQTADGRTVSHVRLGPLLRRAFLPGAAALDETACFWTVAHAPSGLWWVLATTETAATQLAARLESWRPATEAEPLRLAGYRGHIIAAEASALARRLGDLLAAIARPEAREVVHSFTTIVTGLLDACDEVECEIESPGTNRVRGEWRLRLRPVSRDGDRPGPATSPAVEVPVTPTGR